MRVRPGRLTRAATKGLSRREHKSRRRNAADRSELAPILLFRVGASIIQLEAHPGAGPRDTERRGQAEMEQDARVKEARMCL
jgi:hypothetical protein